MNELKHLAIIMDGNGRWAKKRGFIRTNGHEAGALVVEQMCEFCCQNDIEILSLYAFSTENWKRPKSEVDFLMNLLKKFLISRRETFVKNGIKFQTIGDITPFSNELKVEINTLKDLTKNNSKLKLNLAINYGSRDEIVRAVNFLNTQNIKITEDSLKSALDEPCDIDLLIRTGGELRMSNFMLFQASYAEFAFTDTLWPDFKTDELGRIISEFKSKNRRFGGI